MVAVVHATSTVHLDAVRALWAAYWKELGFTPCFQGFEQEMAQLPGKYAPPSGRLLIGVIDGRVGGAVAFRDLDGQACEAKRLYVASEYRGQGIARILMEHLIEEARAAGYRKMIGDTMPVMTAALALYHRMGFRRTDPYPGSSEGAICIEYVL